MNYYPIGTTSFIRLNCLFKSEKTEESRHMSDRMVKTAALLKEDEMVGWQLVNSPRGMAEISLFGSECVLKSDLEWIAETMGKPSGKMTKKETGYEELYELYLPVSLKEREDETFGLPSTWKNDCKEKWPNAYFTQFEELMKILRQDGGIFRAVLGSPSEKDFRECQKLILSTYDLNDRQVISYLGKPVRARFLLLLPTKPSIRLRAILEGSISGVAIRYIGSIQKEEVLEIWEKPLQTAVTLPETAAKVLLLEPIVRETILGIEVREQEIKPIPASHKNSSSSKFVTIGKAMTTAGIKRNITLADVDLRRHFQIVGQTGCGKSTLLANMILSGITKDNGFGVTFFDPHGSTIDVILHSLPKKYADRVRVVRIGDLENPVPFKLWDSADPEKEEKNINQFCELIREIFDPNHQGFAGPRYDRWLSTFAKASIAFLGDAASLESICVLSQNQNNMLKLAKAINDRYPELVEIIKSEYGTDRSLEFNNFINWYLCKFQRLTAVPQLRNTLGASANAIDFKAALEHNYVTLIDLASPTIGSDAARIMGTILLMKLWDAVQERKNRDMTHLLFLDEAALFQSEPLPSMLAQARKYGLSISLCHQHNSQLSQEIQDALEANSASFCAFRLSAKDAYNASIRFDDENMLNTLPRLNAFNAITTLSVDGIQTEPFTLQIHPPKVQRDGDLIANYVEEHSRAILVEPYRACRALTRKEVQKRLDEAAKKYDQRTSISKANSDDAENDYRPQWLIKYLREDVREVS